MSGSMLIGTVLVVIAVVDAIFGFAVVVPRVQESRRGVVRLAIGGGALGMFCLGAAFLLGWIGDTA